MAMTGPEAAATKAAILAAVEEGNEDVLRHFDAPHPLFASRDEAIASWLETWGFKVEVTDGVPTIVGEER